MAATSAAMHRRRHETTARSVVASTVCKLGKPVERRGRKARDLPGATAPEDRPVARHRTSTDQKVESMAQVDRHESGSVPSDANAGRPRLEPRLHALRSTRRARCPPSSSPSADRPGHRAGRRLRPRDPTSNSMANTTAYTGAAAWWDAGYTGAGRRRRAHRHGRQPGRRASPRRARSSTDPTSRSSPRRPTCATSTRTATARSWPASSPARTPPPGRTGPARLSRHGPGRPDRVGQGRRRRRRHGRQPGHRRDRLGRPAPQRQRPEHPGHQPLVRHQLGPGLHGRPARLRGRAGLEGRHRRRRRRRQLRLPEPHEQRPGAGRPGHRPLRDRGRLVGLEGHDDASRTTRCRPSRRGRSAARRAAST